MSDLIRDLSNLVLMSVERFYLRANGWQKVGPDAWDPPADYPYENTRSKRGLRQGHAINSQKQLMYKTIRERIHSNWGADDITKTTDQTIES